jgi:geranylgeranyl pyrophosphate synthase
MLYFKNCTTIDDVKKLYKQLAKENHPDVGGILEIMQAVNREYSFAIAKLAKGESLDNEEVNNRIMEAEAYRDALEKISHLQGITIEIVGTWIWVTGNTYIIKEELKAALFVFAPVKKAWYFRTAENKKANKYGKFTSLEEIKSRYGSEKFIPSNKKQFLTV